MSGRLDVMDPSSTITALDRMLDSLSDCLNAESAERIVAPVHRPRPASANRRACRSLQRRITRQVGAAEYESYVEGAEILSLIKLKARRHLMAHGAN